MEHDPKKDPARLALVLLRYLRSWDQGGLARASGIAPSQISVYDRGDRAVPRDVLERVAAAAGLPGYLLDPLLRSLRSFQAAVGGKSRASRVLAEETAAELIALVCLAAEVILGGSAPRPASREEDREEAAALWERLRKRSPEERRLLVEEAREYQTRALSEILDEEGRKLASDHPEVAKELAGLARRAAELAPGEPPAAPGDGAAGAV